MKSSRKITHTLLMAAGCAAMLVVILTLTFPKDGSRGVYLLLLLCSAIHFLMHRQMNHSEDQHNTTSKAQLPTQETGVPGKEWAKLS